MSVRDPLAISDAGRNLVEGRSETDIMMDTHSLRSKLTDLDEARRAPKYEDATIFVIGGVTLLTSGLRDAERLYDQTSISMGDAWWSIGFVILALVMFGLAAWRSVLGYQNRHLRRVSPSSIVEDTIKAHNGHRSLPPTSG